MGYPAIFLCQVLLDIPILVNSTPLMYQLLPKSIPEGFNNPFSAVRDKDHIFTQRKLPCFQIGQKLFANSMVLGGSLPKSQHLLEALHVDAQSHNENLSSQMISIEKDRKGIKILQRSFFQLF